MKKTHTQTHAKSKHNKNYEKKKEKNTVERRKSNNASNINRQKLNTNKAKRRKTSDTFWTLTHNTYKIPSQQHRIHTHTYTTTHPNKQNKQ